MCVCAAFLVGCDDGGDVVPVSGVITLDGAPFEGSHISTQPIAESGNPNPGSGSFGRADENGRFTLELVDPSQPGAIVGEHRVKVNRPPLEPISSSDDRRPVDNRPPWPRKYNDGSLRLTVPADGTNAANFDLTSERE